MIIKLENFAGIAPRYSARLLPVNGAVTSANAKLLSGELRGFAEPQLIKDFNQYSPAHDVARAFRIPGSLSSPTPMQPDSDHWIYFYDPDVDFVRTPVLDDSFGRYYWTGDSYNLDGAPQYNTSARIIAGDAPYLLGVPAPTGAVSIDPPSGSDYTRAYTYTFVSAYGEEGPPAPPTTATGDSGTWTISGFDTSVSDGSYRNITTVRIYRTVAGATTVEYYFVADVDLGTTSYSDTSNDAAVALNNPLPSLTWEPPPANLLGLVAHPGGFLVGFSGRDLYMSEPYQPHAWPVQYVQTCQTEITGVAIFNNMIIVTTNAHPYVAEGMTPLNVTMQKKDSVDPCISRRSIATTINGVFYASPQGIVVHDGNSSTLASYQLFTRQEWQEYFSPTSVYAAPYGLQYIAFDTASSGFIFSPAEQLAPLTTLDRWSNVTAIQIDQYTGDAYLLMSNQVWLWDPPNGLQYEYTWTSKEFDLPKPVNFSAFRLKFVTGATTLTADALAAYESFDAARFTAAADTAGSLDCIGLGYCIGDASVVSLPENPFPPQNMGAVGSGPLYSIDEITNQDLYANVTIKARTGAGTWQIVYQSTISGEGTYRLPAGFKSDGWQVEIVGNTSIYSFVMAETAKELKQA